MDALNRRTALQLGGSLLLGSTLDNRGLRAAAAEQGAALSPTLLFFGCRAPRDYLYQDELAELSVGHAPLRLDRPLDHGRGLGARSDARHHGTGDGLVHRVLGGDCRHGDPPLRGSISAEG